MGHSLTAEALFQDLKMMPTTEQQRFFVSLSDTDFHAEDLTHEQLFGQLADDKFTALDAAEYQEVSLPTFRRYVVSDRQVVDSTIARDQFFAVPALKALKKALQATRKTA